MNSPVGNDVLPLASAILTGGADIRAWPITTTITRLSTGVNGLDAAFDKKGNGSWPDIVPPGWTGPIYYTVWLGAMLADGLHLAASLVSYRGQQSNGVEGAGAGDVTNIGQYSQNLWYLDPALKAHIVTEGETLYLLVTAGGFRGLSVVTVQERSQLVAFQASSTPRTFLYEATTPPPLPPTPLPPPTGGDTADPIAELTQSVEGLERAWRSLSLRVDALRETLDALDARLVAREVQPIPTGCSGSVNLGFTRVYVSCTLQYKEGGR
jgi:hypothetical protein